MGNVDSENAWRVDFFEKNVPTVLALEHVMCPTPKPFWRVCRAFANTPSVFGSFSEPI